MNDVFRKSKRSMSKKDDGPLLDDLVKKYEKRTEDLGRRHRELTNRIAFIEKSLPMLMTYIVLTEEDKNDPDRALDKIRKIIDDLTPGPNPEDVLYEKLTNEIEEINKQTSELHNKIIEDDVEMKESAMELASLQRSNAELMQQIEELEDYIHETERRQIDLSELSPADRAMIKKLRELMNNEFQIKRNIEEMEKREMLLRNQMDCIVGEEEACAALNPQRGRKHHAHKCKRGSDTDVDKSHTLQCTCGKVFETKEDSLKARRKCKCRKSCGADPKYATGAIPKVRSHHDKKDHGEIVCNCQSCSHDPPRERGSGSNPAVNLKSRSCNDSIHSKDSTFMKKIFEYLYDDKTGKPIDAGDNNQEGV